MTEHKTRAHRNGQLRLVLAELDSVTGRMRQKIEEVLREQYPTGTEVRWTNNATFGPWYTGRVLEWPEDSTQGQVRVRNVVTGVDTLLTARQIVAAGDEEE